MSGGIFSKGAMTPASRNTATPARGVTTPARGFTTPARGGLINKAAAKNLGKLFLFIDCSMYVCPAAPLLLVHP